MNGSNDSMNNNLSVYKVIGAPGTGKTTRVVGNPEIEDHTSLIQKNLEDYPLEDQMIVTYTNAGADEAAERLAKITDETKDLISDRVTTIHSQCFRTLELDTDQTVSWWDKRNFCKTYDMSFEGGDDEGDLMSADKPEGNSFFDIYGWLKSNRKDIEEYEQCPQEWSGTHDFTFLAERWEMWKEENNKKDFSDMIEEVVDLARMQIENLGWGILFPDENDTHMELFEKARHDENHDPDIIRGKGAFVDTKVLYVDEVQDLTPLQWCWYLAQKLVAEKVYIGGDDDQTIYGWAGAEPRFMLDEEGDFEVLDKTYRIPAEVWDVCDGVIQQVDKRQHKNVTPHGDGGEVLTYKGPSVREIVDHIEQTEGRTFILFRARFMIEEFCKELNNHGIPYDNVSTYDTWTDDVIKVRDALAKLYLHQQEEEESYKLKGDELRVLLDMSPDGILSDNSSFSPTEQAMSNFTGVSCEDALSMFDMYSARSGNDFSYKRWVREAREYDDSDLNYYQGEAIKGSIENRTWDMERDDVVVGTIHSSKGKEAETVILGMDTTTTIAENIREQTMNQPDKMISDAERRVYYVGMTRSSNKLILCENLSGVDASLRIKDLLADEHLEEYGPQQEQTSLEPSTKKW